MERLRILVVDDHALFRDGLASLMALHEDLEVVGEAGNGIEALEKARELKPDLILMDIKMPHLDGLEATRAIKKELPQIKIVMLTVHDEEQKLFEAIRCGAQGYLIKNVRGQEFLDLVRGVARGEAPISRSLAGKILKEFAEMSHRGPIPEEPISDLTVREMEVLQLVAGGDSNKEIAAALYIAENTVKNHLKSILDKLHLKNRSQAAAFALRKGLINPPPPL